MCVMLELISEALAHLILKVLFYFFYTLFKN